MSKFGHKRLGYSFVHFAMFVYLCLVLAACRSKIDSDTKYRAPEATPAVEDPAPAADPVAESPPAQSTPEEFTGGITSAKTYFQTRNAINVSFSLEALASGQTFKLINETTGVTLIPSAPVPDLGAKLLDGSGAEFSLTSPTTFDVTLYPAAAAPSTYKYGENVFHLIVDDPSDGGGSATWKCTLKDFNAFSTASTSFASKEVRSGGLEGGFGLYSRTTTGGQTLGLGFLSIVNQ